MMKKILLLTLMAVTAVMGLRAEEGDFSVAPQVTFGTKSTQIGVGLQIQFEPTDRWRVAPDLLYYIKNKGRSAYDFNINVHYLFPLSERFSAYPLAGISYVNVRQDGIDEDGKKTTYKNDYLGANLGGGVQYKLQDYLYIFAEERFQVLKRNSQSVTALGVRLTF